MAIYKFFNIKNIISMLAAAALAVGFSFVEEQQAEEQQTIVVCAENTDSQAEEKTVLQEETASAVEIPELSCAKIEFSDGSALFANSAGSYTLADSGGSEIAAINIIDDDENSISVICYANTVSFELSGEKVDSFRYNSHLIELADSLVYYDKSPVVYTDTAFSAYQLNDKYAIECTAKGKYILRNSDGETAKSCKITDDAGTKLTVNASDNGFEAVNSDDLLEIAVKLNGDLLVTEGTVLYINGTQLLPAGYYDPIKTDSSSQQPLEVQQPPKQYGSVDTSNENISDDTAEILTYINEVRLQYGLNEVGGLEILDNAAQTRAQELSVSYSHTRPDGTDFTAVFEAFATDLWDCAECIASDCSGNSSVKDAFDCWLRSEENRAYILNPKMKYAAAAVSTTQSGESCWTLLLINDQYVPD